MVTPCLLALLLGPAAAQDPAPFTEPYPWIFGADSSGAAPEPLSPDPLVSTTWSGATNITGLQIFNVTTPVGWVADPPSAFSGLDTLSSGAPHITVHGSGSLRLDFGREHAAWFEFQSTDLGAQAGAVRASISEYNEPWDGKTQTPKAYAGGRYRLETNDQLYEGVRYAWIFFEPEKQSPNCAPLGKEDTDVELSCPAAAGGATNHIKSIKFAEFGTATGDCHTGFQPGGCAVDLAPNLTAACVGRSTCTIHCIMGSCHINGGTPFSIGGDPCPGTPKHITAQVECAQAPGSGAATPWHITDLKLVAQSKPTNYTSSFKSSDPTLTAAWYSGAYGSRLNMMPYGFNSILMDRGDRVSIQGDGHPTMAAALAAFPSRSTYDLVHEMLVKTDSGCANHSQCNVVDDGLMTYPLCWASSVHDWYWASGDTSRFLQLAPDIGRIVDNVVEKFMQPGLGVQFVGWDDRIANGFCGSCNLEVQLAFAAFTIRACNDFATSLAQAGDHVNATKYNHTAVRLAKQLRARPSTTVPGGDWTSDYGVHAASYLIDARIVGTMAEQSALAKRVLTNSRTICSWSPFNQYWILQALGNIGMLEYAHASIKLCWGPMLELGKGCFWELHSPEWSRFMVNGDKAPTRPSYCHPWSDGVTPWLTHVAAGIQPLEPGFSRFAALPHVSGRLPSVSASAGTPHGPISVTATRDNTRGVVNITTDALVDGVIGLRMVDEDTGCELDLETIQLNGVRVAPEPDTVQIDRVHPVLASQHAYVAVPPGQHSVAAAFATGCLAKHGLALEEESRIAAAESASMLPGQPKGFPVAPPYAAPSYPGTWVMDNHTGGDWIGKYGAEGYQLFAFDANNSDVKKLPTWVSSVGGKGGGPLRNAPVFVGADSANKSYLVDPRDKTSRALGFVTQGADGSQGTVLDVNTTTGVKYKLTLYMVGCVQPKGKPTWSFSRQAIRVMDLATLDPIAMDPLIERASSGVYWSLTYDRAVRLRVMPMDSDAGASAVFFDKAA